MKIYHFLFILSFYILAVMVATETVQAQVFSDKLTITNVTVEPNPFSPNDDGVHDLTTIRFVLSTIDPPDVTQMRITFDADQDGLFEADPEDLVKDITNFGPGDNQYLWDGDSLAEGVYPFQITAWSGVDFLADAFGSVVLDLSGPAIDNVTVSLSPFSPNGDGINDVTEIGFTVTGTNPPGFTNNNAGTIEFSIPENGSPFASIVGGGLPALFPFGVRLVPIPDGIFAPIEELEFQVNGSYKRALVFSEFKISPAGFLEIGEPEELFDSISTVSDLSPTLESGILGDVSGSATLSWFTGNAVVNIYNASGRFLDSLEVSPFYIGDRSYHVRWNPIGQSDGVYIFRIFAEDGAGNVSQRSGEIIISSTSLEIKNVEATLDRISPANVDLQSDSTTISYELSKASRVTARILDASNQSIRTLVSAEPEAKGIQNIIWDGKDDSGLFVSINSETSYTYVITAVDTLTSDTAKVSDTIIVDNEPPEPPQLDIPASLRTNLSTFEVTGTAEPGATVQVFAGTVSVGSTQAATDSGAFSLPGVPLNVGINRITALSFDSVGNANGVASNAIDIHFDETAPVTVVEDLPSGWQQDTVPVKLIRADEPGGSGIAATYFTTDGSLPDTASNLVPDGDVIELTEDGIFLLRFFSVDNAGNAEDVRQASDFIRIDRQPPTIGEIVTQVEAAFVEDIPLLIISGTTDDGADSSGVQFVEIEIPDIGADWTVVSGTATWQYSFIPDVLLTTYNIRVRATDNAGNINEAEQTIAPGFAEAPTQLTATPISEGRIRLTWSDTGEAYNIYRATFSRFTPSVTNLVASNITAGVWIDARTTDQTEYYYKIRPTVLGTPESPEAVAIADKVPPAIENIANVPNPFSPNNDGIDEITTISFTLTEETFVALTIYPTLPGDVPNLAAPVLTLRSEVMPAGDNLIEWAGLDADGNLVDEGVYVYRFEKSMTLDASGNTLLRDISGSITLKLTPPLETKVLEVRPNPFSPNADRVKDIVNLNYTLSDIADFVAVNVLDTSTGQPEVIATLRAEALEYVFSGENWVAIHAPNGIPAGRSDEAYYLAPVDPRNSTPPPFGLFGKPLNAQTINDYLANYQATNPNWRPVPFTISWAGQGATRSGAYVYHLQAVQADGTASIPKTGVIFLEGIVVVPDDKTPPVVVRAQPPADAVHSAQLDLVSADLDDGHGTGVNLTASTIRLIGLSGTLPGRQSNDGIDTITWTLDEPLADDGSQDGFYTIVVSPVDFSKNRPLEPLTFFFEYNSSLGDEIPPSAVDANDSPLLTLTSRRAIKLAPDSETLIEPEDDEALDSIEVLLNDIGSGIDLSASTMTILTHPRGILVAAEKREAPTDRFSGKLILRKIALQFDGTYALRIQPIDNAGNAGEEIEYLFKYKTVDDTLAPSVELQTLTYESIVGDVDPSDPNPQFSTVDNSLADGVILAAPIVSFSVDFVDPAPSVGFNLDFVGARLVNGSGEAVPANVAYSTPAVTPAGVVQVRLILTLNTPFQTNGRDDGDYTLEVTAADNVGNTSPTETVSFKFDTIAPAVNRITQPLAKLLSNLPAIVSAELEDTPNASGIAFPGSTIALLAPDGSRVSARTPVSSEIQGTVTILHFEPDSISPLEGIYTIEVIPKDQAGNTGAALEKTFLLDNSPPTVTAMLAGEQDILIDPFVSGEVREIRVVLTDTNGIDFQHPETVFELEPPPESIAPARPIAGRIVNAEEDTLVFELTVPLSINGTYTATGTVADGAGNLQNLELSFIYDNTRPTIKQVSLISSDEDDLPLDDGGFVGTAFNTIVATVTDDTSGIDSTKTRVVLKDESGGIVPGVLQNADSEIHWLINEPSQLQPGIYTVEVEATDEAGNQATQTLTFGFTFAPQLNPTVVSVTPKHGERLNRPISQVSAVVADNSGSGIDFENSTISVEKPDGTTEGSVNSTEDTLIWSFPHPLATDGSDDGEYTVHVTVVDNAGNRTEPPPTVFFYDTTPPSIVLGDANRDVQFNQASSSVNPPDGTFLNTSLSRVSIQLTDPAGIDLAASSIQLHGPNGTVTGRQTHNGVDTLFWEFSPLQTDGSDDGVYQIRVQPADVVGNRAVTPAIFTFTYDTRPPVISQSEPKAEETVTSPLEKLTVTLSDDNGSGIDITNSLIKVFRGLDDQLLSPLSLVTVPGVQSDNGVDTLVWTLDRPLASDGSDDGIYLVEVMPQDTLGNAPQTPVTFQFTYTVRAPALVSTTPDDGARLNEPLNRVLAVLRDRSGTGLNVGSSKLLLRRTRFQSGFSETLGGALQIQLTDASDPRGRLYSFTFTLDRALATDASDDGVYSIEVTAMDNVGSAAVYTTEFVYDTQPPGVVQVDPESDRILNEELARVHAALSDVGTAVDLVSSTIQLVGPTGSVVGRQTNDGRDTINWEFAPLKIDGSADGIYTIKVVPVDILGNRAVTPFESQFRLDTTPPAVSTEPAPNAQLQIPILRVEARLDDGAGSGADIDASSIRVFDPSGIAVPGTPGNDGAMTIFWNFEAPFADDGSVDGRYTIEVISQDVSGNRSDPLTFAFEYRSKTPLLDAVTPQDGAARKTPIETVSARLIDQSGTGLNLAESSLTVVGAGVSPDDAQTNNGADTFFWTFANPLATDGSDDGTYTITITGVPNVGGSATYTTTFTYDTTSPVVISTTPAEGTVLLSSISDITVVLADAGAGVDLNRSRLQLLGPKGNVPGGQTNNGVDTLRLTFDPLSDDGEHTIVVQPWDTLGNTPPTARRISFLLDTTPPGVLSTVPAVGETLIVPIDSVSVTLKDDSAGVDIDSSTVRLVGPNGFVAGVQSATGDSQSDVTLTWTLTQALSADGVDDGMYEIVVSAADQVGNALATSLRFPFTYTTKAPGVVSSTPPDKAVLNTAVERVSVVLQDNSGAGIDFTRSQILLLGPNAAPVNGISENDERQVLALVLDNPLALDGRDDGEYTLKITAFDQTGAKAQYTRTFTYDTTSPTVVTLRRGDADATSPLTDEPTATAFSVVEAVLADEGVGLNLGESKIQLTGPRGNVSGGQTNNGTDTIRWEFELTPADGTVDGVYTVTATPEDRVGNVGAETRIQFIYDTTPPRVSSTIPKADSVLVTSIDRITVELEDGSVGTGIDFANSAVSLNGPNGDIPGVQTDNGVKMLFFSFAPLALDDTAKGSYQITVVPQDGVGNQGPAQTFSFTYQPTAPILAEVKPEDGARLDEPPRQITVRLTDQSGTGVNFQDSWIQLVGPKGLVEGDLTDNGQDTMHLAFDRFLATDGNDDGVYTTRVFSVDNRGNQATYTIGFVYDTTPPEVISTLPEAGSILNSGFNRVAARLADAHVGVDLTRSSIRLTGPGGVAITGEQQNNGLDTVQLQFSALTTDESGDGVYTIIINPVDVLDNAPPETLQFRFQLDTTPPKVIETVPADGAVLVNTALTQITVVLDDGPTGSGIDTSQSTVELTGPKGKVGATLALDDRGPSNRSLADADTLTLVLDSPLVLDGTDDGRYTITVEAFDKASNRSEPFQTSFVYDTVQPGSPVIQNISVQPVALSPNDDGVSDTTQISYILSKPATVTVQITDNRFNVQRALLENVALDAGKQSLSWDGTDALGSILPDGSYTVTFDARDASGLTSALESMNVVIDTQPPIISHLTVSDNPFTPDGDGFADVVRIQFTVTNSSPQDNVTVVFQDNRGTQIATVDVTPPFKGDGDYAAIWNGLGAPADGEYTYTILAQDGAANVRELTGIIALDKNAPQVTFVEPEAESIVTNQSPFHLRGSVTDFSGLRSMGVRVLREDGSLVSGWQPLPFEERDGQEASLQSTADWEFSFDPPSDGAYTFNIRATDTVGHREVSPNPPQIILDTTAPQHLSTAIKVELRHATPQPIPQKVTVGESIQLVTQWDAPGYQFTATFFERDEVTAIDNGKGEYLLNYRIPSDTGASDGLKTVRMVAIDAASNQATVEIIAMELDSKTPQVTSVRSLDPDTVYRNDDTIALQLTADTNDYVVTADFSPIDQNYQQGAEQVTNNRDNTYTVKYQISSDNTREAQSIPVLLFISDGVHTTTDNTLKVQVDNTAPVFGAITPTASTYRNGETVIVAVSLDGSGYTVTANFSELDSAYVEGAERVTDNRNNTYTVRYAISAANTKVDVRNAIIGLQAQDVAGNLTSDSFGIKLDNTPPKILRMQTADADRTYKNGDTVTIVVETDEEGYVVNADFSLVDSQYNPDDESVDDVEDGRYNISYTISNDNTQASDKTLKNLPVRISVSDEKHPPTVDTFTVDLDNQPPVIEITSPLDVREDTPLTITNPEITIQGKTEAQGSLTVAPAPESSDYNADTGVFSFTLKFDLDDAGEHLVRMQATDLAGNIAVKTLTVIYNPIVSTIISASTGGMVALPEERDDGISGNDTEIVILPNALPQDVEVTITRATDDEPLNAITPLVAYRIELKHPVSGEPLPVLLNRPATLVLQFPAVDTRETSSAAPQQSRTRSVAIFRWDGVNWNNLGGQVQRNNTVEVQTTNIVGLFAVQTVSTPAQKFTVRPARPNPFTPNSDGVNDVVELYFDNPSEGAPVVRIYDIRGALIRELQDIGLTSAIWDGRDDMAEPMPLGLYLYQVEIDDEVDGGTITLAR